MNAHREAVVEALRSQGQHDRALQAACSLPVVVDLEQDAGVLSALGIDASVLDDAS